jgi:multimeric flavodoxin WrbA
MVLAPFVEGMAEAGGHVTLMYASQLDVKPCSCGRMACWYQTPGECCLKDGMQAVYPKLWKTEILVLATPVYIPLPGAMQDFVNRLCPLINPRLKSQAGRTRGRLREGIALETIALVSTGGWWERENFSTVERIAEELAEICNIDFAGAALRPHAFMMKRQGALTPDGHGILEAMGRAGCELVTEGQMRVETLEAISHPLISHEEFLANWNAD